MMLEARPQISQNNKLYLKKSFSQMQGTLVLNECLVIQYTRRKNKAYLFNEHIHKFINDTVFLCGEHIICICIWLYLTPKCTLSSRILVYNST